MVNHHFGRASEVWKHLIVTTVLTGVRPAGFAETHAGSARNVMDDLPERAYGVRTFLRRVGAYHRLNSSPYTDLLRSCLQADPSICPGSALIAMTLLDAEADVLLCDVDPDSAADLRHEVSRQRRPGYRVLEQDGLAGVADWLPTAPGPAAVHVDPFDPAAMTSSGLNAIELAAEVADTGTPLAYWYGYDNPAERLWALNELATLTGRPLVWLDMAVLDAAGRGGKGDLGQATTPGTGFGHVLANVPGPVVEDCARLGVELAQLYDGVPLPDGATGTWRFSMTRSAGNRPAGPE